MLARNAICGWLHLLILTPAVLAETSPAKYQVKIDRLYKIGGTVAIQSSGDQTLTTTPNGGPAQTIRFSATLTGTITINEVSPVSGLPTKFDLTVATCQRDGKDLFPTNALVSAAFSGGPSYTYQGNTVSQDASDALNVLLIAIGPIAPFDPPIEDSVFGTAAPKKSGDLWQIDGNVAAPVMAHSLNMVISPTDASGVTLVTSVNTNSITVKGTLNIKNLSVPQKVASGTITQISEWDLPTDLSKRPTRQKDSIDIVLVGSDSKSETIQTDLSSLQSAP
jgi:hypothetical protein